MNRVRTYLIDLHFAHNLSYELFEEILREALEERGAGSDWLTTFNAELAPQELLFEQATRIYEMPAGRTQDVRGPPAGAQGGHDPQHDQ